jgi:FkbM family methyltransferase
VSNGFYQNPNFITEMDFTNLKTIFELGAGRGVDTVEVFNFYEPENLYAFEADPINYAKMTEYLKNFDLKGRVRGFNLIVSNKVGIAEFWRHPDYRSSGVFKHPKDECEKITVNSVTLDMFCQQMKITSVDLILSDIQSAEILVFLNQRIMQTVQYVICPCALDPKWKPGFPLISDLEQVLLPYGLKRKKEIIMHNGLVGNFLFAKEEKPVDVN